MTELEVYEAPPKQQLERLTPEQIRFISNTDIIPKHLRGNPEKIMATILKGRSLGLDDISSLSAIHVIEGKAGLASETMVHLVRKHGHSIVWEAKPGESCTVVGTRRDNGDTGAVTWTMAMAKDAGLASRPTWKSYPDSMLWNRAVSQLCRMLFADVLMGTSYSPDELEEVAERGRVTAAVTDLPVLEEAQIRTEPLSSPSDALLNRIAALETRSGDGYKMVLRGVFGVDLASELSAEDAARYEATLELALPTESAEVPLESTLSDEAARGDSSPDGEEKSDAVTSADNPSDVAGPPATEASEELPGEPEPDEVVEAEAVEVDESEERLVELAGETEIPLGNYRGTKLKDIHDGWITYSLQRANTARLPDAFVEALTLWVKARKPELWEQVRG